ncbi:hypothetical protein DPSP01_003469 [Paraphaeosphaeria sporulosa]
MPPKAIALQKNKISSYFSFSTPSQPSQNAAFASSPAAPSTIQETPTNDPTTTLNDGGLEEAAPSSPSSPLTSRSPSPTDPRGIASYEDTAERGLPSLPQSSGNSTNASKRTFSRGNPVVLNSDSDTDSLTDLEDLLDYRPARSKAVTRAAAVWTRGDPEALALPQPPKRKKDDHAFKRLVQAAKKNAQREQEIAQAQAELDKPLRQESPQRGLKLSENTVADVVHDEDDPDKAKKLYLAMQRTNAFQVDCVFHFFNQRPDDFEKPFPIDSINPGMIDMFRDETSRDQAFTSGFARLLFSRELPEELADWMIDEVCFGASEALGEKYLQILSASQLQLRKLLDVARLEEIFNNIGADRQYTTSDSEVAPSYGSDPGERRTFPPALTNVCKLLQLPGSLLHVDSRRRALKILFILCMDNGVQMDNAVLRTVQDTIESLICPIPNTGEIASILEDIISHLLVRVRHPILQRNLVTALPTRYPLTASFQRHLALSFLLHPAKITHPLTSPETLKSIHDYLQTSTTFRVQKNIDYNVLAAHFMLLDIAIGPGPLTVPFQLITSPSQSQESQEPIEPPNPTSDEVNAFNREVDALAQQIRLIGNSINVAGAITDLSRLTASDACDRLHIRLGHVVRIGGRKSRHVFGGEEESEGDKATFAKFFARKKLQLPRTSEM